jgi:hypothetical protein
MNSSRIAITSEKMDADSEIACPTNMFLMMTPAWSGLRAMASDAWLAVYPSPVAAPMAPKPMATAPPI